MTSWSMGRDHVCFPSLPGMYQRTILLQGFSKSHAMTGWRVGYAAAPGELLDAMRKVHQYTIMSAPTTSQWAALAGLHHAEKEMEAMVAEYDRRRKLIVGGLNEIGLSLFRAQGGFLRLSLDRRYRDERRTVCRTACCRKSG